MQNGQVGGFTLSTRGPFPAAGLQTFFPFLSLVPHVGARGPLRWQMFLGSFSHAADGSTSLGRNRRPIINFGLGLFPTFLLWDFSTGRLPHSCCNILLFFFLFFFVIRKGRVATLYPGMIFPPGSRDVFQSMRIVLSPQVRGCGEKAPPFRQFGYPTLSARGFWDPLIFFPPPSLSLAGYCALRAKPGSLFPLFFFVCNEGGAFLVPPAAFLLEGQSPVFNRVAFVEFSPLFFPVLPPHFFFPLSF